MVEALRAVIANSPLDPSGRSENCPDQSSCSPALVAALDKEQAEFVRRHQLSIPLGCPDPCAPQLYHHEIPGGDAPGMKALVGTLGEASPRLQPDPGPASG